MRERGGIAIVIAHRPSALATVDRILVLREGVVQAFGPREEVMAKMLRQTAAAANEAPARPARPDRRAGGGFGSLSASAHIPAQAQSHSGTHSGTHSGSHPGTHVPGLGASRQA